jgi:Xaa-Pro aminopeptidase
MNARDFARRRKQLMRQMGDGGIAILPAAPERQRNRDVDHPYRQHSDFLYLTGFPEPEAVAVLVPGRPQGEFLLFCRERDPEMETWHGRRAGLEGACERHGADDAFPIGDLDDILPGLLENTERVYASMGGDPAFDRRLLDWINLVRDKSRAGITAPVEIVDLDHLLHEMRLIKSPAEIRLMRKAAAISSAAHIRAMRACRPGLNELDLEAELQHAFATGGARHAAYPSIVGSGANACILHYTENRSRLRKGDLVLIDAGAEVEGYAADITRTFPVGPRYNRAQRAIYELVLEAQQAAIDMVRPGNHWNDPHDAAVEVLATGLVALGLLKGRPRQVIAKGGYRRFYMHRTGHWLGLDVHDVGDYKVGGEWRVLEPGMTLTIEPGLYLPAGEKGVGPRWADIGVRIEDDVLVTAGGHEVLTAAAPKSVADVEALRSSN